MVIKKSIEHLKNNNMGYWKHMIFAAGHGFRCIRAGLLLIVHSLIPAWFPKTGSILVNKLNESFTEHNELLKLKSRVEAFKKIVYHYRSKENKDLTRDCR